MPEEVVDHSKCLVWEHGPCDTCGRNEHLYVYALPRVPVTVGNCSRCLRENLYPWWILIGNTEVVLGIAAPPEQVNPNPEPAKWRESCAQWWQEAVDRSLPVLGKTEAQFIEEMEQDAAGTPIDKST